MSKASGVPVRVNMVCTTCGYTARRDLVETMACRGHHEAPSEFGLCPRGHGQLVRKDGMWTGSSRCPSDEE